MPERGMVGRPLSEVPHPVLTRRYGILTEVIETLLLVLAIYVLVNLVTARFVVEGRSMEPNFHTDEFIIVSRLAYVLDDPERGDVIVFHYDEDTNRDFIKRVIGLPGETVRLEEGQVYINNAEVPLEEPYILEPCTVSSCNRPGGQSWELGPEEYFVMGDSRNHSEDSRSSRVGFIEREQIIGKAWIRYWPPDAWDLVQGFDHDDS
jgi:signal peptidase I